MSVVPDKWADLPFLAQRSAFEWSAACPSCKDFGHVGRGDPDRFRIFTDGKIRGWCRSCGFQEFADNIQTMSPQDRMEMERERVALANRERIRIQNRIEKLTNDALWKGYHDGMNDAHRKLWRDAGINNDAQDWWDLGYNPSYSYKIGNDSYNSPTMTIPFWREDKVVNLQQRLLEPAKKNDKYRFAYNVPSAVFLPEKTPPVGRCLVVEGAKKAMVAWLNLAGDQYGLFDSCVGIPSKSISRRHASELQSADSFLLCLDPDAVNDGSAIRGAEILGADKVKIVYLPYKIDDLFVDYKATPTQIASFIKDARQVR